MITCWIGALARADNAVIDLGPQHPTRAGLVRLDLEIDNADVVTNARLQPGFLHRSAEKLFEVRDYRQVVMLADRHDWQSPFTGELVVALACEQLWGLIPPPRATWLRTLLAETSRIISHLAFLSWLPFAAADAGLASRVREAREGGRELMLTLSGNRLHPMLNRLGGLASDASPEWIGQLEGWLTQVEGLDLEPCLTSLGLPRGLGLLTAAQIDAHGVSGPAARAAGLDRDLRRHPGPLAYDELEWSALLGHDSDVAARFRQWMGEVRQSVELVRQCLRRLEKVHGPIDQKLAKIIKLPDAETRISIESPNGVAGVHLVSRGGTTPWRLALRTPTFSNVNALQMALVGSPIRHVDAVIASLGWTIGDLDK